MMTLLFSRKQTEVMLPGVIEDENFVLIPAYETSSKINVRETAARALNKNVYIHVSRFSTVDNIMDLPCDEAQVLWDIEEMPDGGRMENNAQVIRDTFLSELKLKNIHVTRQLAFAFADVWDGKKFNESAAMEMIRKSGERLKKETVSLVLSHGKSENPFEGTESINKLIVHVKDAKSLYLLRKLSLNWHIAGTFVKTCHIYLDERMCERDIEHVEKFFRDNNSVADLLKGMKKTYVSYVLKEHYKGFPRPYFNRIETAMLDTDISVDLAKRFYIA